MVSPATCLVLVILVVSEHFFGIWGLILGVPVAVYVFRVVILDIGIPGITTARDQRVEG